MKKFFLISFFLFVSSCNSTKTVYWCGDHQCTNNKERKAYFAKTMIIEIREINKKSKNFKADKKEQKEILKQARLDEKKRKKAQKRILKQARLDEKKEQKRIKENKLKKIYKAKKNDEISSLEVIDSKFTNISRNFNEISERITNDSLTKPYPDINVIIE